MRIRKYVSLILSVAIFFGVLTGLKIDVNAASHDAEIEYWKGYSTDYYYNQLTADEKRLYDKLDAACIDCYTNNVDYTNDKAIIVDLTEFSYSDDDVPMINRILTVFESSNLQYFFTVASRLVYDNGTVKAVKLWVIKDFWKPEDRKAAIAEVKEKLEDYLKLVPSDALPEQKEKIIHDEIIKRNHYGSWPDDGEPDVPNVDVTIYAALNGISMCTGHARLFSVLMNKLGFTCLEVQGHHPDENNNSRHAWNQLYIHGNWYIVDTMWDEDENDGIITYGNYNSSEHYYVLDEVYMMYSPVLMYDNMDNGLEYSSPYFDFDGNTYFIVNENSTYSSEKLALCITSETIDRETADHNGKNYRIINSTGAKDTTFAGFVERLYQVALNRKAETGGKDYWCRLVSNQTITGDDCARSFLTSDEFKNRNLSDEEFVKVLYKTFFDRNAEDDPEGFRFWLNSLKTVGKDTVVEGFINSQEWKDLCNSYGVLSDKNSNAQKEPDNVKNFVIRLYIVCLGRNYDEDGLAYWHSLLVNHEISGSQIGIAFFTSQELKDRNLSDEDYVALLYSVLMDRFSDVMGRKYWKDLLATGTSREEILYAFVTSEEFVSLCEQYGIIP